jgi:copper homeostasis protein (lipoprotein)
MNTKLLWLVASIALLTSACQKDEVIAPTSTLKSGDMLTSSEPITGVQWTLVSIMNEGTVASMDMVDPHAGAPWFLLKSSTNDVVGATGCNDLTGHYRLIGDQLGFLSILHTRRYCSTGNIAEMEGRFLKVLSVTDRYRMEDGVLILMQGQRELARLKMR